jgi:hypothetical protein
MYDIIMAAARADLAAAQTAHSCAAPVVFASRSDGYQRWADRAAGLGRAADWRTWSEDEPCPQRAIAADAQAAFAATPYCGLGR